MYVHIKECECVQKELTNIIIIFVYYTCVCYFTYLENSRSHAKVNIVTFYTSHFYTDENKFIRQQKRKEEIVGQES